ncbi:DUF1156 domain-containing protein [Stygiolobus caldivivus]|uniref:DUF1156 domain-containing protein n=1 Tax=Stygiolobus caldivivus TaxID=2824673 RepID=A0A8D5ZHW6_9CREN|nr:DUF1156 domain-containing protein [Stygiolobus caldivivus]BCU70064.1 hypothetical protein KN1_13610 [Stygiolobus caldivivus]
MKKLFIESDNFSVIVPEIDRKAAKEKGPGRPPFWEIVFWWGREPLLSARAFITASLLPEDFDPEEYKRVIRLDEDLPHKFNPEVNERFRDFTFLDPFAGFGSFALEAKRLGLGKVIASDPIPTAYTFLKGVLLYPKYGKKLITDVEKYGEYLVESLEEDVRKLYGYNTGYVGSWEVKCPVCGNYTPLSFTWRLLELRRVGSEGEEGEEGGEKVRAGAYKRLVYMRPVVEDKKLRIEVVDLNKEVGSKDVIAKVSKSRIVIKGSDKSYEVPQGNVKVENNYARCLYCGSVIQGKGGSWYVREAIREWNENYEKFLNGEITLEELRGSRARPTLLVKFRGGGKNLDFQEITDEDKEVFWEAFDKLKETSIMKIPTEKAFPYGLLAFTRWGMDRFYKLFNARQLVVLTKIVDKINELRDKVNGDEDYKDAVLTYLTMAFLNHVRYNSMITSIESTRSFNVPVTAFRGFAFSWTWVEISPLGDISGSLTKLLGHVKKGLEYLVNAGGSPQVQVPFYRGDLQTEPVDLIVTDPPFENDKPYVSDYFYVWLKRVFPFPYDTQWEEFVPKDVNKPYKGIVGTLGYFRDELARAFLRFYDLLKDDGTLVTFFSNASPEAWVSLLYAGWSVSKFRVVATHAVTTKDRTRMSANVSTVTLDKSIVVAWRKRAEGSRSVQEVRSEAISSVSKWFSSYIKTGKLSIDTYMVALGKVLSIFTKYERVIGVSGSGVSLVENLIKNHVYPATTQAIIKGLSESVGVRIDDPYSSFYVLVKVLSPPARGVRKIDKNSLVLLNVTGDIAEKDLEKNGVIQVDRKKKVILLAEPENATDIGDVIRSFEKLGHVKGAKAGDYDLDNPVQVLHYLEYVALKFPDKLKEEVDKLRETSRYVNEALAIARVFSEVLPENDVEKTPSRKISGVERLL